MGPMRESEGRAIRRAISELDRGQTTRLPETIRRRVMEYVRQGRAESVSWRKLAQGVGLSLTTLRRWQRDQDGGGRRTRVRRQRRFVPVRLEAGEAMQTSLGAKTLRIRTSGGLEIAGLGLEEVVTLVKALSDDRQHP